MVIDVVGNTGGIDLHGVTGIALIDDAFIPISANSLPEPEREAVIDLLSGLDDSDVLSDFAVRGVDKVDLSESPDRAFDVLTDPDQKLVGYAFARVIEVSATLESLIQDRYSMRRLALMMREMTNCEVLELPPETIPDLNDNQLVFIDHYLERDKSDGARAEEIAKLIDGQRNADTAQQIILMSSFENVKTIRKKFRREAGIDGAAFSFVAKGDLDERWKIRAHLEMFARALPHSRVIAEYITSAKKNVIKAQKHLNELLNDLDLGDFAYIQKLALRDEGHPLGDYLSWLFSSHLASFAFEYDLRKEQAPVDAISFGEEPVSPAEPSTIVATLYHDAIFCRNLGELGPHPGASDEDKVSDVPLVGLGDLFVDSERTKAVVVLSADCDLAFAPSGNRKPDKAMPVHLIEGTPVTVGDIGRDTADTVTEGMVHDSDVYRINWDLKKCRAVALGDLKTQLGSDGFDISGRDRLRPLYALKLQRELSDHIFRIGHPVMPPIRMKMKGDIFRSMGERERVDALNDDGVFRSFFKGSSTFKITMSVVGRLRNAVEELLEYMRDELRTLEEADQNDGDIKRRTAALRPKVEAVSRQLNEEERWIGLLCETVLPETDKPKKLLQGLYLVYGSEWTYPNDSAVVFQVIDQQSD